MNSLEIIEIINRYRLLHSKYLPHTRKKNLELAFQKLFNDNNKQKCVLGIDIYKYSKYNRIPQSLIPFIFLFLFKETITKLLVNEKSFFTDYCEETFNKNYISTGDGGFLIFENPLQALTFLIYFQINLTLFNTTNILPEIRTITGAISLRYAMTFQSLYSFENNWYGKSIINNARILSKDKLNRFIIDDDVKEWFDQKFNGIETLRIIGIREIEKIPDYAKILNCSNKLESLIFSSGSCVINNIYLSKLDDFTVKDDRFTAYNIFIQIRLNYIYYEKLFNPMPLDVCIITIGNLNSFGL